MAVVMEMALEILIKESLKKMIKKRPCIITAKILISLSIIDALNIDSWIHNQFSALLAIFSVFSNSSIGRC